MKHSLPKSLAVGLICLLLSACVSKQIYIDTAIPGDQSQPNYSSMYYYMVAHLFVAEGKLSVADLLLKKAETSDPGSIQIKRQILQNSLSMYQTGELDSLVLTRLIDRYASEFQFDEELLYATYGFYEQVENTAAMQSTIKTLQKRFPSARAYLQQFIFEFKNSDTPDLRLLDSALKLAQNDVRSLYVLSNIYAFYDQSKAKQAIWRFHELAPSEETHAMLVAQIFGSLDLRLARKYLATLEYPADRIYLLDFADAAISSGQSAFLGEFSAELLATKDIDLITTLGLAAVLTARPDLLEQIARQLPELPNPPAEKQSLYSLLIAQSLQSGEKHSLDNQVAKLTEAKYFEDILAYYNYAVTKDLSAGWSLADSLTYATFIRQTSSRLQDSAPLNYLQAIALAVRDSSSIAYVDAKYELILHLKGQQTLSAADYEFLLNYYFRHDGLSERRSLLDDAVLHYPEYPSFCNDLGYTLLLEGTDPVRAAALIQIAVEAEPENPYYLDSLAWSYYLSGDYSQALELTTIPQTLVEMPAEIAWHIGSIYFKLGDFANARVFLEKCIAIGSDPVYTDLAEQTLKLLP